MRIAEVKRCHTVGRRAGLSGAAQADHQVRADGVGRRGAFGVGRGDRPRQERLHADGRHPAFEPTGQVPQDVCLADRSRRAVHDEAVVVAAARIDDDPLAGQPWPGAANQLFADGVGAAGNPEPRKYKERNVSGPQMPSG